MWWHPASKQGWPCRSNHGSLAGKMQNSVSRLPGMEEEASYPARRTANLQQKNAGVRRSPSPKSGYFQLQRYLQILEGWRTQWANTTPRLFSPAKGPASRCAQLYSHSVLFLLQNCGAFSPASGPASRCAQLFSHIVFFSAAKLPQIRSAVAASNHENYETIYYLLNPPENSSLHFKSFASIKTSKNSSELSNSCLSSSTRLPIFLLQNVFSKFLKKGWQGYRQKQLELSRQGLFPSGGKIILMKNRCAFVLFFLLKIQQTPKKIVSEILSPLSISCLCLLPPAITKYGKQQQFFFHYWSAGEEFYLPIRRQCPSQAVYFVYVPPLLEEKNIFMKDCCTFFEDVTNTQNMVSGIGATVNQLSLCISFSPFSIFFLVVVCIFSSHHGDWSSVAPEIKTLFLGSNQGAR